jgi:hypothetical protein
MQTSGVLKTSEVPTFASHSSRARNMCHSEGVWLSKAKRKRPKSLLSNKRRRLFAPFGRLPRCACPPYGQGTPLARVTQPDDGGKGIPPYAFSVCSMQPGHNGDLSYLSPSYHNSCHALIAIIVTLLLQSLHPCHYNNCPLVIVMTVLHLLS